MTVKDIFVILRLITDHRNIKMLLGMNRELARDKQYSIINLFKALWLVTKDEKIVMFDGQYVFSAFLPPVPHKAFYQVFNSVPKEGTKYGNHVMAKRTAPISMYVGVTDKCGYKCWHCSKANRGKNRDIPLKDIKKLMKQLQDMGTAIIGITGGEPMLRKDIIEIVSSIDDRSVTIMFTTGQGLTLEKAKALKKAGLFSMGISLDHYDKDVFNRLRGSGKAYDTSLRAIEYCKQAGIYTMIQTVATRQMIENGDVWKMIKLAKDLKVQEIKLLETMPSGRLINMDAAHVLTVKEREQLMEIQKKANWSGKYPKVTSFAQTESFGQFGCGAGSQHSYIDAQGNLSPCDFVPLSFGNVLKKPVDVLWRDMNALIGAPRNKCMILELFNTIKKEYRGKLPLDYTKAKKVISKIKPMQELPGFYKAMSGNE